MQILGIHWDPPYFRVACLRLGKRGVEILGLDSSVKLLYKADFRGKIVTALPGKDVLIRSFTLNVQNQKYVEKLVQFQSETTSHLPQEEILSSTLFLPNKQAKTTDVTSITALRQVIGQHLQFYASLEIFPHRVGAVPQALLQYALWKYPLLQKAIWIDLGSSEWTCIEMHDGKLRQAISFPGGIEELLEALWEDRKKNLLQKEIEAAARQIDLLQLKPELNPHLYEKLLAKRQEIAKAIYAFSRESEGCPVLFSGRTDSFVRIREYLLEGLQGINASGSELSPPIEEHKYAISIGLSLEERTQERQGVQFLQGEFFPRKNWKKAGIFSSLLFSFSLICSALLLFWGKSSFESKEKETLKSIEQMLPRYESASGSNILQEHKTAGAILQAWMKAMQKDEKQPFYMAAGPKVSSVLHWLSHHPLVKTFREHGEPLEWKEIRYRLIQFPTISSPGEPYRAQVELCFTAKNATQARKFHEALLKGDEFIDSSQPIGWETCPDGYKASVFLHAGKTS